MMMMTIWWSKATRLLEFSRSYLGSLYQRYAGNNGTREPGFFVTDGRTEELGILVVGCIAMKCCKPAEWIRYTAIYLGLRASADIRPVD